jgi:prophage regulatory protein
MKAVAHTKFDDLPDIALIQMRSLINYKVVPLSPTTIWRKCRKGEFPKPIKVSAGITAWRVKDIRVYLNNIATLDGGLRK